MAEAQAYHVAPWDVVGVPEAAGMDVWLIWRQQAVMLDQHRARLRAKGVKTRF